LSDYLSSYKLNNQILVNQIITYFIFILENGNLKAAALESCATQEFVRGRKVILDKPSETVPEDILDILG